MFFAGTAFGQALWLGTQDIAFLKDLPPVLPCMTIAAGRSSVYANLRLIVA